MHWSEALVIKIRARAPIDKDFEGIRLFIFIHEFDLRRTEYWEFWQSVSDFFHRGWQHSTFLFYDVCLPHSLISHLSNFWKSRNYPLTVLASPVAAEIITKKVWTANKFIVLKVMLTDVKLITIHVVRLTGVTTLDACLSQETRPTHSHQTDEWTLRMSICQPVVLTNLNRS